MLKVLGWSEEIIDAVESARGAADVLTIEEPLFASVSAQAVVVDGESISPSCHTVHLESVSPIWVAGR